MFKSFYEKGFALPAGAFLWGLLHFYGLEVTRLKPNSIAQITIFIHLCEGYLGIAPHFNLWRALYRLRGHPSNVRRNIVGGAAFSLCQGSVYPNFELRDTNKGRAWEWFVVSNKGCPKALCLKRPTDAVSFLESSELFCAFRVVSSIFAPRF